MLLSFMRPVVDLDRPASGNELRAAAGTGAFGPGFGFYLLAVICCCKSHVSITAGLVVPIPRHHPDSKT